MKSVQKFAITAVTATLLLGLGGCSGMSTHDQHTAIGAGTGAAAGAILTGGSTTGTLGGAVIGGVIGSGVK